MSADLKTIRPLVEIMAAERTGSRPDLFEEAVQEGLVAAWSAAESKPDAEPTYFRAAARYGVTRVVRGRPLTGSPGRRGWEDAHDHGEPLTVTDADGWEHFRAEPVDVQAERAFTAAEIRERVLAGVKAIPDPADREATFLRFWRGLTYAEISKVVRVPTGTLSRRWTDVVRPFLREHLKELRSCAE